jgi:hypothetical protein
MRNNVQQFPEDSEIESRIREELHGGSSGSARDFLTQIRGDALRAELLDVIRQYEGAGQ